MLHDGIGIPRVGIEHVKEPEDGHGNKTNAILDEGEDRAFLDPFQAVDEIDGTEVSWTLGKMVLYASSQMPPADGAMAVGFGSNILGSQLPADFQHPSGQYTSKSDEAGKQGGQAWRDRILSSSYSRRIPGILIFLLILALAVYLLCGRERRLSWWHKVTGRSSSRPSKRRKGGAVGLLSSKLFGKGEPSYERVLEDATDPPDFELASVISEERYSDSSNVGNPPRQGRTSGWATPSAASRGLSPDVTRSSPKSKHSYFDAAGSSSNSGLGITPFERGGLSVRAESRERLASTPSQLGRSQTGSPKRSPLVVPLSPFKESVD